MHKLFIGFCGARGGVWVYVASWLVSPVCEVSALPAFVSVEIVTSLSRLKVP